MISPDDEDNCQAAASYMIGLAVYPYGFGERYLFSATSRSSLDHTSRHMRWLIDIYEDNDSSEELKKLIRRNIANDTRKKQSTINAALIIFNLFDLIRKHPEKDFYEELINAMWDKRLTVKYANSLYCLCHNDINYTNVKNHDRYYLSRFFMPHLTSFKWQETISKIREIVMVKLYSEIEKLALIDAVDLLHDAKTMPIFCEDTSNLSVSKIVGCTDAVTEIDAMLKELENIKCERITGNFVIQSPHKL